MKWLPFLLVIIGCSHKNAPQKESFSAAALKQVLHADKKVVVYKTNGDYNLNVPVVLSEDKSTIVAYPSIDDVKMDSNRYKTPLKLKNGYLLDLAGISKNSVFLSITYEEYAQLKSLPSLKEMYAMIITKEPFVEFWDCRSAYQYKDIEAEINAEIKGKNFKNICMPL